MDHTVILAPDALAGVKLAIIRKWILRPGPSDMIQGWAFRLMPTPNKVAPTMLPSRALLAPAGLVMLALILLLATPVIERLVGLSALDGVALGYADDMGSRTFTLFLAAKSMNAALSVLENASISLGAVMSVAVAPGKVLEPVDDLVEQLSVALLGASGAAYLLKSLALLGSADWILRYLAPAGFLLLAVWRVLSRWLAATEWAELLFSSGRMLLVVAFVLRLALPGAIVATAAVSNELFGKDRKAAEEIIGSFARELGGISAQIEALGAATASRMPPEGLFDWMREKASETTRTAESVYKVLREAFQAVSGNFDALFAAVGTMVAIWLGEVLIFLIVFVLGWKASMALLSRLLSGRRHVGNRVTTRSAVAS